MPHEYLSEDQTLRYRVFVDDSSSGELEMFFRMDAATVEHVKSKRRPHNRLGWSVQWGTVRMLGTLLSSPAEVPDVVRNFMAEQVDVAPACLKLYPDRLPTQHEHAREIRELLRHKELAERELDLRSCVASRVWNSVESRRALFDRADRRARCPPDDSYSIRTNRWFKINVPSFATARRSHRGGLGGSAPQHNVGVAVAGVLAARSGEDRDFFLADIWWYLVASIVLTVSIVLRRPLVGVLWSAMQGVGMWWRHDRPSLRRYNIATAVLAAVFAARFVVLQGCTRTTRSVG